MKVKYLVKTCDVCPAQWDGELKNGQTIYIRYRYGVLSWGIGKNLTLAVRDSFSNRKHIGDDLDGSMTDTEMAKHLKLDLIQNRKVKEVKK